MDAGGNFEVVATSAFSAIATNGLGQVRLYGEPNKRDGQRVLTSRGQKRHKLI